MIVPTRHVMAFYDLDVQEQQAIRAIIGESQKKPAGEMALLGVDIGFQDGETEPGPCPRPRGAEGSGASP